MEKIESPVCPKCQRNLQLTSKYHGVERWECKECEVILWLPVSREKSYKIRLEESKIRNDQKE